MSSVHLAAMVLGVIAGALFLLSAFGTDTLGGVHLIPLGLVFFVAAVLVHGTHHHV